MPPPITLTSPVPAADLLFQSMSATAGLSTLGEAQLSLLSLKPDIKPEDLLGKPVTVTVQLREGAKRHFHGYVTRFGTGVRQGRYYAYQATVHSWLWFLTRTADCRIFQDMTVPDIVKKVFEDHGVANFEFKLFRSYRSWVYCVQYRESDYNFIARLLEHEGIYWYFEHSDGQHKRSRRGTRLCIVALHRGGRRGPGRHGMRVRLVVLARGEGGQGHARELRLRAPLH